MIISRKKIKKKQSQNEIVLYHLLHRGPLSQLEAWARYRIMRLASRINELRKEGHPITTEYYTDTEERTYGRYTIH